MAKPEAGASAPAKKSGLSSMLLLGVVGMIAGGGGFAVPYLLVQGGFNLMGQSDADSKDGKKPGFVPFGDVVVNLAEERLTRYLRVKLILVVDASQEKAITELVTKNKAILKNWLISHMSDKSLAEVSGATGVNRLRREIQDQFNALLFPDGSEKIRDVLFEEFVVQ
jgi:flagellar FliL protein